MLNVRFLCICARKDRNPRTKENAGQSMQLVRCMPLIQSHNRQHHTIPRIAGQHQSKPQTHTASPSPLPKRRVMLPIQIRRRTNNGCEAHFMHGWAHSSRLHNSRRRMRSNLYMQGRYRERVYVQIEHTRVRACCILQLHHGGLQLPVGRSTCVCDNMLLLLPSGLTRPSRPYFE